MYRVRNYQWTRETRGEKKNRASSLPLHCCKHFSRVRIQSAKSSPLFFQAFFKQYLVAPHYDHFCEVGEPLCTSRVKLTLKVFSFYNWSRGFSNFLFFIICSSSGKYEFYVTLCVTIQVFFLTKNFIRTSESRERLNTQKFKSFVYVVLSYPGSSFSSSTPKCPENFEI